MKIALCQMHIAWEEKQANMRKAEDFIKQAAEQSVDLLLFPEMCLTGFSMNIDKTKEENYETLAFFSNCACQYNIKIGFGWTKAGKKEQKAENHFTLVDEAGGILLDYIKIHPFRFAKEDSCFVSGEEIKICKVGDFNISTFICYDLRFPEVFQAVSDDVDLIVVAANWPKSRSEHWKCLLKARAIENQVYVLGVNAVGQIGNLEYSGDSCIIDPYGKVRQELTATEGIIICDLKNDVRNYRESFPVRRDRKVNLYRKLL